MNGVEPLNVFSLRSSELSDAQNCLLTSSSAGPNFLFVQGHGAVVTCSDISQEATSCINRSRQLWLETEEPVTNPVYRPASLRMLSFYHLVVHKTVYAL
jgi:hypothetical protein